MHAGASQEMALSRGKAWNWVEGWLGPFVMPEILLTMLNKAGPLLAFTLMHLWDNRTNCHSIWLWPPILAQISQPHSLTFKTALLPLQLFLGETNKLIPVKHLVQIYKRYSDECFGQKMSFWLVQPNQGVSPVSQGSCSGSVWTFRGIY